MTDLGPPLWACVGGKATIIMDVEDLREHPELIDRAEAEAGRLIASPRTVAECVARADSYAKGMEAAAVIADRHAKENEDGVTDRGMLCERVADDIRATAKGPL